VSVYNDILVVGGGPVGAALALALADSGLSVTVLEARAADDAHNDQRVIALSYGSRLILQRLGAWDKLESHATAIATIHISQKACWGRTILDAAEMGQPALGYTLPYSELNRIMAQALQTASGVRVMHSAQVTDVVSSSLNGSVQFEQAGQIIAMTASLLALANGGRMPEGVTGMHRHVRDYGQSAVVARIEGELPHCNVAYERFSTDGPVALLPTGEHGFALVWTVQPERAEELCRLQQQEFLDQLGLHFGERVGRFVSVSGRAAFALKLSRTVPVTTQHLVTIGNAAQTLHPVAGQGFNLGLRDAWGLAQIVCSTPQERIGDAAMLAQYRRRRLPDRMGGIWITDFLATAFAIDLPGLAAVRGIGMGALDLLVPAKQMLSRKMSFGAQG